MALQTLLSRRRHDDSTLYDIGKGMIAQGFTETAIMHGLIKLAHGKGYRASTRQSAAG